MGGHGFRQRHDNPKGIFAARRRNEQGARQKVVVGGPYVSTSAEEMPDADHIFVGEAEATLPEYLSDLERAEFWRYLQRATASHRRNFARAVTLAAMGYHFRNLTEAYGE